MKRCLAALALLALPGGFAIPPAQATEGGVSLYVPGLRATLGSVVPPPGSYFENTAVGGTIGYNFLVGQTPVSTRVKVLREVETESDFATPSACSPSRSRSAGSLRQTKHLP